ncbi:MAG: hypothetical protein J6T15_06565 [Bacilli bacterium]|nr:hypothetical protein [Bacilli bacterium]
MKQQTKYQKLHQKYIKAMDSLSDTEVQEIAESIESGRTHVLKMKRIESSSFDTSWIARIEDCIYDLGAIVQLPKITTKTVGEVVKVELARKIGAESVQHLSSHTNYIKEIDENGNVIPSKILNLGSDDQYATYENRFIATLIRHLVSFVQKRLDYVLQFAEIKNADVLFVKNKSTVDGMEVEIETKIKITQPIESSMDEAKSYIDRCVEVKRYMMYYYNSEFMKKLKNERDVRNPIMMTNILKKNPAYHKCYELYRFIESYDSIGVNHNVSETYADFSDQDFQDVNKTLLANFFAISSEESFAKPIKEVKKESKPRVLDAIDDEMFIFGPIQKGPIQTVRMDEEYLRNLQARSRIPPHLNNKEREYYEDEISERREQLDDYIALRALIRRKKDELKIWEQRVATAINRRQYEEEVARKKEELRNLREREQLLRHARNALVESAKANEEIVADKLKELEERQAARAQKEAEAEARRLERAGHLTEKQKRAKARRHKRYVRQCKAKAIAKAKEQKLQDRLERKQRVKEETRKLAKKMKPLENQPTENGK